MAETVLVGCYTQSVPHEPEAAGPGIVALRVTPSRVDKVGITPPSVCGHNPSYLAVSQAGDRTEVYAANEVSDGTITRMRLERDGSVRRVSRATCGKLPCHVATVAGGVVAACFGGTLWSYLCDDDGSMRVADSVRPGDWYDAGESGLHQALPMGDGRLVVCDPVGGAVSVVRRLADGSLRALCFTRLAGAYPRHAALLGGGAVAVACAGARAVATLRVDGGAVTEAGRVSLAGARGALGAIRAARGRVLVSERGAGRDGVWTVRGEAATWRACGGAVPRDVAVGERVVVATHQRAGTVGVAAARDDDGDDDDDDAAFAAFDVGGARAAPACAVFVPMA